VKIIFLFTLSLYFLLKGCFPTPDDEPSYSFLISVDSVSHPKSVNVGETVSLKFYGFVGNTICDGFKNIDITQTSNSADITVWGYHASGACSMGNPTKLNGVEKTIVITNKGMFYLNIKRSGNGILKDSILVI
jgi:hypothetical protein